MNSYKRVLFVTKDDPFGIGGGCFATHSYLKAFSELCNGNIDVFLNAGIKTDLSIQVNNYFFTQARGVFSRIGSIFSGELHRHTKPVLEKLLKSDTKYDLCVFNNSKVSTGLINPVKRKGIRVVTIHHNVEPEYVRDNTPNCVKRALMLKHVTKAEKMSYLLSDFNLFLTQQDMESFHQLYGKCKGKEGVIGTFEVNNLPELKVKEIAPDHLIFAITGSLCTVQGVDGIVYFFEELYKFIPKSAEIIISGRRPTPTVIDYCNKHNNVRLVANPDDMAEIINQSDIYICPTRLGGGLKLRVMDGLKLGIPVITHSCSARGYDAFLEGDYLTVFNNGNEFGKKLEKQIKMIKEGKLSRKEVRKRYEDLFSYETGYKRVESLLYEDHI